MAAYGKGFASRITVCASCGREVQGITANFGKGSKIIPCGHAAQMLSKPNPLLSAP